MSYSYDRTAASVAYSYNRTAADDDWAKDFEAELRKHTKLNGRQLFVKGTALSASNSLYVTLINLPTGVGGAGGGAEAENNRMSFMIRFEPDHSKAKIEQSVSALPREYKLRAKTAPPAAIAKYLGDFLSKVTKEVEPRLTHTKMA